MFNYNGTQTQRTLKFVNEAADFYSNHCVTEQCKSRSQLVERLQVTLLKEVGKRLLVGSQATLSILNEDNP